MSQLDAPFSHACGIISLIEGGRSFISWVWRVSYLLAFDKLIADLMALPASLLVMRVVCCFKMFSVSCRLAISEFLYSMSAMSTGLIIASPPNFAGRENRLRSRSDRIV